MPRLLGRSGVSRPRLYLCLDQRVIPRVSQSVSQNDEHPSLLTIAGSGMPRGTPGTRGVVTKRPGLAARRRFMRLPAADWRSAIPVCASRALSSLGHATEGTGVQLVMRAIRSRRTLVSCGALLGLIAVLLAFALFASKDEVHVVGAEATRLHGGSAQTVKAGGPTTDSHAALPSLTRTADADVYAKSVGGLVFGLDSRNSVADEYRRLLRSEADPDLTERGQADLFATIDARIPSEQLWNRMRGNGQWSEWSPSRTWEPAAWSQVVTGGYAEPGWVMRNVTGTQTTHYIEAAGVARTTTREPTLSVVMRCPAPGAQVQHCALVLISTTPVF
jgi:hypothetical protein